MAMSLVELIQGYGYWAVAAGAFLEGETMLLVAGAAASRGHLSLPAVEAVAALACLGGDQLWFYLGGAMASSCWRGIRPWWHARRMPVRCWIGTTWG